MMLRILLLGLLSLGCTATPTKPIPTPVLARTPSPVVVVAPRPPEEAVVIVVASPQIEEMPEAGMSMVDQETPLETAILNQAMRCSRARVGKFDRALLRDMLRLEEEVDVPLQIRGIVLVAACHESGYDPKAAGDHKFSASGKPMAIGIMQQWPWWAASGKGPKIDRLNPRAAARAWLGHIAKQVPTVKRRCRLTKPSQIDDLWRVAWLTGVRAPSKRARCKQTSAHWARFQKWRPAWEAMIMTPPEMTIADKQ